MAPGEPGADGTPAERCEAHIFPGDAIFGSHQCTNKGKVEENGGWRCGVHGKAARTKRRVKDQAISDKRQAGIQAAYKRDAETERRASHFDALVEALQRYVDSDGYEDAIKEQARAALDAAKEA